jgi:hypothetical protein
MEGTTERDGVRVGMRVRDLDGKDLGRVTEIWADGFGVEKGFPILFGRDLVATWDEVRDVSGGEVTLARSDETLLELAEGGMPAVWRMPVPAGFPDAATPGEARQLVVDLATLPPPRAPRARAAVPASPRAPAAAPDAVPSPEPGEPGHARPHGRPVEPAAAPER